MKIALNHFTSEINFTSNTVCDFEKSKKNIRLYYIKSYMLDRTLEKRI